MSATPPATASPGRKKYVRAVGPRLRKLLYVVFGLLAVLGANSGYLAAITFLEWFKQETYQNYFYQYMFLAHLVLGLLLIVPFLVFGIVHMLNARGRRNRRAVRVGYALFAVCCVVLVTGLLLLRIAGLFDLKQPQARWTVYWLHVACPLAAGWLYWLHRLAGPRIKWRIGLAYAAAVGAVVVGMAALHSQDPRKWNVAGPKEGEKYYFPSLAKTSTGNFIPAQTLMMDSYCLNCHQDAYQGWFHSSHHFSSFNNPPYLSSVTRTREVLLKRDGNVKASRWCAGCHDPVPFFSGAFDDPNFDVVKHRTAQAGITCTVCHAITNVNSTRGNADYTIEEPVHYPFAFSDNPLLQFVNQQLVKAKPEFHKKTFLKPLHKTAEFCSTCHKVHLPYELNHYREFVRGQNHYDPYLLSGVSGRGARSFYYPPKARQNCAECHMPAQRSNDFGAKLFADVKEPSIHNHLFPAANTGLAWLKESDAVQAHEEFLRGVMRIDLFGVRRGGTIDGELSAPLRPEVPALVRGEKYLLEAVIRTLKLGHLFTQGTVDSNEVWVDLTVSSGGRVIGRSGGMDDNREVDRWAHYVNVFLLDKDGNRINRRNPEDIFVALYNHQIPPGAAQTVHYGLELPLDLTEPVTVEVKLQYRKFDQEYMEIVARLADERGLPLRGHQPGQKYRNPLPIVTLASDRVTFPLAGSEAPVENKSPGTPAWERWNDYGIGLLLTGGRKGGLRQAQEAFEKVEALGRYDGPLNLARAYDTEGRLDDAVEAIKRAAGYTDPPAPWWTLSWLSGKVNRQQGNLLAAEESLRRVLEDRTQEMVERGFDFSYDYELINLYGLTLYDLAKQAEAQQQLDERDQYVQAAVRQFERTLELDEENVEAHFNLQLLYAVLGNKEKQSEHARLHARYKQDDNAADRAANLARQKYPAANHAAETIVIYPLNRQGAPGLPSETAPQTVPATGGGQ